MDNEKKTITIKRSISFEYKIAWPDYYPDMSLAEAAKYEREAEPGEIIKMLPQVLDAEFNVEVTVE